jgi:riboflavin synthase
MPFIVPKGSIAIDGTSLTIVDVEADRFSTALVPTTLERTLLRDRGRGDPVNIETDILARLVLARFERLAGGHPGADAGVTWQKLHESGFL